MDDSILTLFFSLRPDGSLTQGDFDLDPKSATHNELLKQLLGTGQAGRQLPTPDVSHSKSCIGFIIYTHCINNESIGLSSYLLLLSLPLLPCP